MTFSGQGRTYHNGPDQGLGEGLSCQSRLVSLCLIQKNTTRHEDEAEIKLDFSLQISNSYEQIKKLIKICFQNSRNVEELEVM